MEKEKFFPFYMTYLPGGQMRGMEEATKNDETMSVFAGDAYLQDWEDALMRSYYPLHIQRMQEIAEGVCDELDYEGSMIYDEYPDPHLLAKAGEKVLSIWEAEYSSEELATQEMRRPHGPHRPGGRPPEEPLKDLARVLLFHEISRRRCRHGRCKRR